MAYTFKLENKKVIDSEGNDLGTIISLLEKDYGLVDDCLSELLIDSDVYNRAAKRQLEDKIETHATSYFENLFEKMKELDESDLDEEVKKYVKTYKSHADVMRKQVTDYVDGIFKNDDKKTGGLDMFKNLKEAKLFTAHLDALAGEIETLSDVSEEMRSHLAFRLDRLSDLIEKSAGAEKLFTHDSVEGDADEKKYMKEFNTDLTEEVIKEAKVLEQDKDESFMKEFNTDLNKEVSNAKSPKADDGQDNDALAIYVKKALAKLK